MLLIRILCPFNTGNSSGRKPEYADVPARNGCRLRFSCRGYGIRITVWIKERHFTIRTGLPEHVGIGSCGIPATADKPGTSAFGTFAAQVRNDLGMRLLPPAPAGQRSCDILYKLRIMTVLTEVSGKHVIS